MDHLCKSPDPTYLPGIDKDKAFDLAEIDILDPFYFEGVKGRMDEEVPKASLLGSRKDQGSLRVELLGSEHGGQRIKIRIVVRGDDFHMAPTGGLDFPAS